MTAGEAGPDSVRYEVLTLTMRKDWLNYLPGCDELDSLREQLMDKVAQEDRVTIAAPYYEVMLVVKARTLPVDAGISDGLPGHITAVEARP